MSEIRHRIAELRTDLGQTQADFGERHGVERAQQAKIERGENKPPLDYLISIKKKEKVTFEWLLEGKGEKHQITTVQSIAAEPENKLSVVPTDQSAYAIKHFALPVTVTVDEHGNDNIVMVDVKAAAGYPQNFLEPKFFKPLPAMKMPGSEFRNGIFRGFQVEGDSMYDTLDHNDWVIGRYCDNHWRDIKEGYIHVLVTKMEIVVKRLLNRVEERGKVVLISDNEQYPTREVEIEDVQEIWLVKARLGYNLRSRRIDWFKKYNDVQAEIVDLKDRLVRLERAGKLK